VQQRWSVGQQVVSPWYEQAIWSDRHRGATGSAALAPTPAVASRGPQYGPPASSSSHRDAIGQQTGGDPLQYL
jgi:hypothetical protein